MTIQREVIALADHLDRQRNDLQSRPLIGTEKEIVSIRRAEKQQSVTLGHIASTLRYVVDRYPEQPPPPDIAALRRRLLDRVNTDIRDPAIGANLNDRGVRMVHAAINEIFDATPRVIASRPEDV